MHENWYLKEIMVENTIAKGQIPDIRWTYTKGIINLREAFNDKIYIVSMGMNTKVQGRLPLLQCITFHSLLIFQRSCSVEILYGKIPEEYDSWKLSTSHILWKA